MANKIETSSKNIKPRINLNHNIYIVRTYVWGLFNSIAFNLTQVIYIENFYSKISSVFFYLVIIWVFPILNRNTKQKFENKIAILSFKIKEKMIQPVVKAM